MFNLYRILNVFIIFLILFGYNSCGKIELTKNGEKKEIKEIKFTIEETKYYKHTGVIKIYDKPTLNMYWVKLEKGGYKLSGSVSDLKRKLTVLNIIPDCRYLTDLSIHELKELLIKEYGYTFHKIYVKSLNGIVEINKEPFLYNPYRPAINPTTTLSINEINKFINKSVEEKLNTDKNFKKLFEDIKGGFGKAGFSEEEATEKAKLEVSKYIKPNIKKWISEEKLPKKLYLVCRRDFADSKNTEITELRLYPVKLKVKREKSIEILSIKNENKYIEITISFYPEIFSSLKRKQIPLDLITIEPVELTTRPKNLPKRYKTCPHIYIGGILYYGENTYRKNYQMGLYSIDKGFYLNIIPSEPVDKYKVYIRLGYYCTNEKRKKISMLNPVENDFSPLTTIVQEYYTNSKFLKNSNLQKLELKLQFVSPTGYKSDIFTIRIQ